MPRSLYIMKRHGEMDCEFVESGWHEGSLAHLCCCCPLPPGGSTTGLPIVEIRSTNSFDKNKGFS